MCVRESYCIEGRREGECLCPFFFVFVHFVPCKISQDFSQPSIAVHYKAAITDGQGILLLCP